MKFVKGSDTSEAAAISVLGTAGKMRAQIMEVFRTMGDATCDEIEFLLDLKHQTASARIRELVQLGRIYDSKERRATRSGRSARIYKEVLK